MGDTQTLWTISGRSSICFTTVLSGGTPTLSTLGWEGGSVFTFCFLYHIFYMETHWGSGLGERGTGSGLSYSNPDLLLALKLGWENFLPEVRVKWDKEHLAFSPVPSTRKPPTGWLQPSCWLARDYIASTTPALQHCRGAGHCERRVPLERPKETRASRDPFIIGRVSPGCGGSDFRLGNLVPAPKACSFHSFLLWSRATDWVRNPCSLLDSDKSCLWGLQDSFLPSLTSLATTLQPQLSTDTGVTYISRLGSFARC